MHINLIKKTLIFANISFKNIKISSSFKYFLGIFSDSCITPDGNLNKDKEITIKFIKKFFVEIWALFKI